MKFPFLTHWPGRRPVVGQVVAGAGAAAGPAAPALRELLQLLPELLLAVVLDTETGELLATYAATAEWQPAELAAPLVASLRSLRASLPIYGESASALHELVLTAGSQLHLLGLKPGRTHAIYLAIASRDTNLALTRQSLQQALSLLYPLNT